MRSEKTGQCKVKSEHAISYGVRRRVQRDQYIQNTGGRLNRHPIRICKCREASSRVNCSQPFRNPYLEGKQESSRNKLQFDIK